MKRLATVWRSTVGQKVVMAVTGVLLFGFVLGHMVGNLKLFQGPEKLNGYAEFLREIGYPVFGHGEVLWILRIGLLVAVALHVWAAARLTRTARAARPAAYRRPVHLETTYASRTMRWGGVIIFVYVVYHLFHLTAGSAHPDFVPGDVYHNMVAGFGVWWVTAAYTVAIVMLGFHLYHGIWSGLQTLGVNHPEINPARRVVAGAFVALIVGGFLAPPYAVFLGFVS